MDTYPISKPELPDEQSEFNFHSEVIVFAEELGTDPHVMAALRTQSAFFTEIDRLLEAKDKASANSARNQLDFFAENNPGLIERANAIRQQFVNHLYKQGFFN